MNVHIEQLKEFANGTMEVMLTRAHEDKIGTLLDDIKDVLHGAEVTCRRAGEDEARRDLVVQDWDEIDYLTEEVLDIIVGPQG